MKKEIKLFVILISLILVLLNIIDCVGVPAVGYHKAVNTLTVQIVGFRLIGFYCFICIICSLKTEKILGTAWWHNSWKEALIGRVYTLKKNPIQFRFNLWLYIYAVIFCFAFPNYGISLFIISFVLLGFILLYFDLFKPLYNNRKLIPVNNENIVHNQNIISEQQPKVYKAQNHPVASIKYIENNIIVICPECKAIYNITTLLDKMMQVKNNDDFDIDVSEQLIQCENCRTVFIVPDI